MVRVDGGSRLPFVMSLRQILFLDKSASPLTKPNGADAGHRIGVVHK